jgi:hypothetical protein
MMAFGPGNFFRPREHQFLHTRAIISALSGERSSRGIDPAGSRSALPGPNEKAGRAGSDLDSFETGCSACEVEPLDCKAEHTSSRSRHSTIES